MTEPRKLRDGEEMNLLSCITDKCATCKKIEIHQVVHCEPDKEYPHQLVMMNAGNLDVVMFERLVPRPIPNAEPIIDRFFIFFRCTEPMCLLGHMRTAMMHRWVADQKEHYEKELEQMRMNSSIQSHPAHRSRRANKRNRAKGRL